MIVAFRVGPGVRPEYHLLSRSSHGQTISRASGVKPFFCGHGKGRKDRYQQNILCKCPFFNGASGAPRPVARVRQARNLKVWRGCSSSSTMCSLRSWSRLLVQRLEISQPWHRRDGIVIAMNKVRVGLSQSHRCVGKVCCLSSLVTGRADCISGRDAGRSPEGKGYCSSC